MKLIRRRLYYLIIIKSITLITINIYVVIIVVAIIIKTSMKIVKLLHRRCVQVDNAIKSSSAQQQQNCHIVLGKVFSRFTFFLN